MGGDFRYLLQHSSLEPAVTATQKSGCGSAVVTTV